MLVEIVLRMWKGDALKPTTLCEEQYLIWETWLRARVVIKLCFVRE